MHDPTPDADQRRLSADINGVVCQLERLSAQRLSATGPLKLDEESTQHLLRDLGNLYRRALELEEEFSALHRSHQRIARVTGIYDVAPQPEKRRTTFAVVGGTDAQNRKS